MFNCIICNQEFKKVSGEKTCSTKCKLLSGIDKDENNCWIWKKSTAGAYGKIWFKKKTYSAHRTSYLCFKGEIPADKWVCHTCDIPLCVNPEHLFLGSASDNMRDAMSKDRLIVGEKNHFAKFTDIQIQELRSLKKEGFTFKRLSRIFNCSYVYITKVLNNSIRKEKNGL